MDNLIWITAQEVLLYSRTYALTSANSTPMSRTFLTRPMAELCDISFRFTFDLKQ